MLCVVASPPIGAAPVCGSGSVVVPGTDELVAVGDAVGVGVVLVVGPAGDGDGVSVRLAGVGLGVKLSVGLAGDGDDVGLGVMITFWYT
mmetsp:Transcript_109337/g.296543  ORF Transcript_109337/g.296543 Transcript_109337/m.296543 type:complete len:89 (-) Transcript_109337:689-955(-)